MHKSLSLFKRSLRYFSEFKLRIVVALASTAVVAASTGAIAFLVKPALDEIFIEKNTTALYYMPILIVLVFFTKGSFTFLKDYQLHFCGLRVLEKLRNELFQKILHLPTTFFDENRIGMLMSRILNDVNDISSSLPSLIQAITHMGTMIALLFVVFYRDPFLGALAVLVLPLSFFPFFYFGKRLRKLSTRNQVKVSDISSLLQEIFSGIKVVKAFASEQPEVQRFEKENNRLVKISIKQVIIDQLSSPVMELIGAIGIGLVVWYGGMQVIQGDSTPGTFFSFMTALVMLYEPIKKLNKANLIIQRALAGAERVFHVLDLPEIEPEISGNRKFSAPFQSLKLQNVSLTYQGSSNPALSNISFEVGPGEKIAIVGPSGSGKTTLVNILPRFYHPQKGSILLNGFPLQDYSLPSLRRAIGIVSQEPFLFNTSIKENIAYGSNTLNEREIIKAAQAAFAHDFIMDLAHGYDTVIGERGVKLSGGQKQRITIARALLKNPPLLILDEATSSLDTQAERIVQKALENLMKDRTSIIIAHRLSTILASDKIFVLSNGNLIDIGTHIELVNRNKLYRELYKVQFTSN